MRKMLPLHVAVIALTGSIASAGNWSHWRGPDGNGAAVDAFPPIRWSNTENVKWKVPLPRWENSSPVIWGDRVYIAVAAPVEEEKPGELVTHEFRLQCYDRDNGDLIWQQIAAVARPHQGAHPTTGFAGASPCTDGEHVYAHFGSQGLYCYTMDGQLVWQRDFGRMQTLNEFGEGSSPTLEGDLILVPWDHQGPSALYALDKRTGDIVWKADRDEPTGWCTPLVVEQGGQKQVVMNGQNYARSYDLATGEELWRCAGQTGRPAASAVAGEDMVFVGSGFQGAFLGAFHLDGRGDIEGTNYVAWVIDRDVTDISSPLLTSGRIYFHKGKKGMLSCVDAATGKPHYTARRIDGIDITYASPVAAGGHVYLTAVNGTTVVIEDADELNVVATNELGENVGGTPAPVDHELFIRGEKHLFCISESRD